MIQINHDDTILRTFILFIQTAHAALKYSDAHLFRKARLSVIKYMVLKILDINGGTMTPSEIAMWTLRERHDITMLAKRMERDGLISSKRNEKDKRFLNIKLTNKGRKVLKNATPMAREIVNQAMLSIAEDDALLLEKLLKTLRLNIHDGLEHVASQARPRLD